MGVHWSRDLLYVVRGEEALFAIEFASPPVSVGFFHNFDYVSLLEGEVIGILEGNLDHV